MPFILAVYIFSCGQEEDFSVSENHLLLPKISSMLIMRANLAQIITKTRTQRIFELLFFDSNLISLASLVHYDRLLTCNIHPARDLDEASTWCWLSWRRRGIFYRGWGLIFVFHRQSHQDLGARPLHACALLCVGFFLLVLEYCLLSNVVNFSINFSHECNRNIWHEIQNIDCCPCSATIEMSWIWQRMRCWALK